MLWTLRKIIEGAIDRLTEQLMTYLPPLLAAVVILAGAWITALLVRWIFQRIFKGIELDRWLRRTGISTMIDPTGRLKGARLVGQIVYWSILAVGFLTALNAFNTQLTSRMVERAVLLLPKAAGAVVIVLAGMWLAQYLGRGALVWAVNEEIPSPRRVAAGVRCLIMFAAVVVASDYLQFAEHVFLAAFILVVGAGALAGGLALGFCARDALTRYLAGQQSRAGQGAERSLWTHL
jgi:small-conductance mechanosensitive channel